MESLSKYYNLLVMLAQYSSEIVNVFPTTLGVIFGIRNHANYNFGMVMQ